MVMDDWSKLQEEAKKAEPILEKYKIIVKWRDCGNDEPDYKEITFDDIDIEVPAGYVRVDREFPNWIWLGIDASDDILASIAYPKDGWEAVKNCYLDLSFTTSERSIEFQMVNMIVKKLRAEQEFGKE